MPAGRIDSTKQALALSLARVDLETGRASRAIRLLRRWYAWTADRHCAQPSLRIAVLLARLHLRTGDRLAARRCLLDALRWGNRGGFIRGILDEGGEIVQLLDELATGAALAEPGLRDYVQQLRRAAGRRVEISATPGSGSQTAIDAGLSERELDIIRLTAGNLVSHEIADALGLTEATVKWYWQRIFEKLGVRKRALAVRAARAHGLIG
jgi:LuxR family maltose regulon positive regulatory protein